MRRLPRVLAVLAEHVARQSRAWQRRRCYHRRDRHRELGARVDLRLLRLLAGQVEKMLPHLCHSVLAFVMMFSAWYAAMALMSSSTAGRMRATSLGSSCKPPASCAWSAPASRPAHLYDAFSMSTRIWWRARTWSAVNG